MIKNNSHIVVLGAGESGTGAALLASQKGYSVFVSDHSKIDAKYKSELLKAQIDFEETQHSESRILSAQTIIKSPGIPNTASIVQKAIEKGIEIISEIEFALRFSKAKVIAITGSNGKTTTTSMCYHILSQAGLDVAVGGNIGDSIARILLQKDYDYLVIEMSSFQLDDSPSIKPYIAILLNITADHLDRYENSIEKYALSKLQITTNQDKDDYLIYNIDDEVSSNLIEKSNLNPQKIKTTLQQKLENGAYADQHNLIINHNNKTQFTMSLNELALQGKHNYYNSMAAAVAANLIGLRKETIKACLTNFQGQPHRMEFVAKIHGVEYINDSKATNVNSAWYALESMRKPVVWIAGGKDKGNNYGELEHLVKEKVTAIICLGKDNSKIKKAFGSIVEEIHEADTAYKAVQKAYRIAQKDQIVLLSPCCASFDLFEDYKDRGDQFKEAVKAL